MEIRITTMKSNNVNLSLLWKENNDGFSIWQTWNRDETITSLHDLLRENKMNFTQFLRTVNFVRDMTQDQLNDYIEAYKNGEFDNHGWY